MTDPTAGVYGGVVTSAASIPAPGATPPVSTRSPGDRRARRLLRLPEDGAPVSILAAQGAFGRSIAIAGTRCLVTYVALPLLGPVVGVSGAAGPILGLLLGAVSMVAIVIAARRMFGADHRWRWGYLVVGGVVFAWLIVQTGIDIAALVR